jgi:hypothetical protein
VKAGSEGRSEGRKCRKEGSEVKEVKEGSVGRK